MTESNSSRGFLEKPQGTRRLFGVMGLYGAKTQKLLELPPMADGGLCFFGQGESRGLGLRRAEGKERGGSPLPCGGACRRLSCGAEAERRRKRRSA